MALAIATLLLLSFDAGWAAAQTAEPRDSFGRFDAAVTHEIEAGQIPGAVVLFGQDGRVVYRGVFGARTVEPERTMLDPDTIFDLASLTKPVATATAIMQLVEAGRLDLDKPVASYWPAFAQNDKAAITVRQLLTHTSGLPADLDLKSDWRGEAAALARVAATQLQSQPNAKFLYSDINFIVLGELVRNISGEPLDAYARDHIFAPLQMVDTGFKPPSAKLARIAATDREHGAVRRGEVQDPTADRMGGVAGHAGLFSTADDLARFAEMLLDGGSLDDVRILRPESVEMMTRAAVLPGGVRRALGWDVASAYSAGMDEAFGPSGYGHTGYTGCLLWIDPLSRRFLIVLTSRLHPNGRGDVKPLRLELAHLVAEVSRENVTEKQTSSLATVGIPVDGF